MENELIRIETKDGRQVVSARELFEKLITSQGKQERFSQWFNRHLKYGFEKGIDFMESKKIYTANQYGGEKELEDYVITIDMAKEICMIQRSDIGREFRKYWLYQGNSKKSHLEQWINGFKNICITPQGVQLIEQHLDEIKNI